MMDVFSGWESLLLGALVLLVIFWMQPGIKAAVEQSRNAKPDWSGLLLPLGFVIAVVFVCVMI